MRALLQASSRSTTEFFSYSGLPHEKKPVLVWWKWWKIKAMLAGKNRLHIIYQLDQSPAAKNTAVTNIRTTVQTRTTQDTICMWWLTAKSRWNSEIRWHSGLNDAIHDALNRRKAVIELQSSSTSPLLNADGTILITDKFAILNMLADHISAVLNIPEHINAKAIACQPQVETHTHLDRPPSEVEDKKTINQLSSGNAPAADAITAEVYKHDGDTLLLIMTTLFCRMGCVSNTSAAKICLHQPPLQNGNSPSVRKLHRNIYPDHSRTVIGTGAAQPPGSRPGTGPTSRESVRLPMWPWDRCHDRFCPPTARNAKSSMTTSS